MVCKQYIGKVKESKDGKKTQQDTNKNKEESKIEEVILFSNTQSLHCEFATPAPRTGAEGVPAGLCGPSGYSAMSTHLAF